MRIGLLWFWCVAQLLGVLSATAHLGSPNVVLEGVAGPHELRVVVQPPPTLPGLAQVSVRGERLTSVTAQVAPTDRPEAAAPTVLAALVGQGLFHAEVWVWTEGAQIVRIRVLGPAGEGQLNVPVQLRPRERPPLGALDWGGLGLGGLVLTTLAVSLAQRSGGSRAAGRALAACLLGALVLGWRWQVLDARFDRFTQAERVPVEAAYVPGEPPRLRLTPAAAPAGWAALAADHGKLMHLFLLRRPEADVLVHLHPARRNAQLFESLLPPLPAGQYELYAEITRQDGQSETLVTELALPDLPGPVPQPTPPGDSWCQSPLALIRDLPAPKELDRDDSWHVGTGTRARTVELSEGSRMVFANAGRLQAGREVGLRFFLTDERGETRQLQLYMGMNGHCVVRRQDGSVFTHLHPSGTVSMAASEIAESQGGTVPNVQLPPPAGTEAVFPYVFPRAGEYRLWVQMQAGGKVQTGVFDLTVE